MTNLGSLVGTADDQLDWLLGLSLEAKELDAWRMSLRALVVFAAAIGIVRLGNKRCIGKASAIDVLLGIIFGSVLSRAINGSAPFFPTLAAGLTLVLCHRVNAALSFHSHAFSCLVKGREELLVSDGKLQERAMARSNITEGDLAEALRNRGKAPDFASVKLAHLERSGDISIVAK